MTAPLSKNSQSGFALLITLIVVSVILAIGLSLIDVTVKQLALSATGRDSELAFHAANAGVECAEALHERSIINTTSLPATVQFFCVTNAASPSVSRVSSGDVHRYSTEFSWIIGGVNRDVCTEIDLYVLDATDRTTPLTYNFSNAGIDSKTCTAGNLCTVVFSRGFNQSCSNTDSLRTVQRELTIEF